MEKKIFYEAPQAEVLEIEAEQCFAVSGDYDTESLTGDEGTWY